MQNFVIGIARLFENKKEQIRKFDEVSINGSPFIQTMSSYVVLNSTDCLNVYVEHNSGQNPSEFLVKKKTLRYSDLEP